MTWKVPEYSKMQIINAGKTLRHPDDHSFTEFAQARTVVDNWRASHAYPLHVIYMFLRGKFPDDRYVVAERLKRLSSIISKLKREPRMNLWTMQDLGGCRVVVPKIEDVEDAIDRIKSSRIRHELKRERDYIELPKPSGYRGVHLVYRFHSDKRETYNRNMLIEVQVRTYLQHLWATAVEAMGLITKQALKASIGDDQTLRFFAGVSSLFALEEGCPTVPGQSSERLDLIRELKALDASGRYLDKLDACRVSINHVDRIRRKNSKGTKGLYYLLVLDYEAAVLKVSEFADIQGATEEYNSIEFDKLSEAGTDVVLVAAASFATIKRAYPNYFSDIGAFVAHLRRMLGD